MAAPRIGVTVAKRLAYLPISDYPSALAPATSSQASYSFGSEHLMQRNIWVVRAGSGGVLADDFEKRTIVAIDFSFRRDVSGLRSQRALLSELEREHQTMKRGRLVNWASQLHKFANDVREGDLVLTPIAETREIMIGTCAGGYEFRADEQLPHVRRVTWRRRVSRDALTERAKRSAGSSLTLFSLNEHGEEIEALVAAGENGGGFPPQLAEEEYSAPELYEEVSGQAEELISDRIARMDPFEFEELVAALLRAMGYHAARTPAGPDRGVDVIAQSDALGLDAPRIKVQVKQRNKRASADEVRSLVATLRQPERGLFVSTGGFSREALYEAERAPQGVAVRTLNRDEFIGLLTKYYETLEPEARATIPLKKVFIPVD